MAPLESLKFNLKLLSTCPYCGCNPCRESCRLQTCDDENLEQQEADDKETLRLARGAMKDAERMEGR